MQVRALNLRYATDDYRFMTDTAISMMGDSSQAATSLLTEHLTYTPLSLIDDIINSINALIYKAVSAVETGLLNTSPANLGFAAARAADGSKPEMGPNGKPVFPEAKLEIENGVHVLETLLEATVDKDFDKFEIYCLRNVLSVPDDIAPWIRLSHYEGLPFPTNADTPTPETLTLQKRKLAETQKLHAALLHEHARNEALLHQLRSILAPGAYENSTLTKADSSSPSAARTSALSFLTDVPVARSLGVQADGTSKPLTTNTSFIASQLPELRALLASLRPKLASLPSLAAAQDPLSEQLTDAEERRSYIESQTRRHLVRNRGLEIEEAGGIRDGEWAGQGRKIAPEEVRALEQVVAMVEGDQEKEEEGKVG